MDTALASGSGLADLRAAVAAVALVRNAIPKERQTELCDFN